VSAGRRWAIYLKVVIRDAVYDDYDSNLPSHHPMMDQFSYVYSDKLVGFTETNFSNSSTLFY